MTTYNANYAPVFTALGYVNSEYQGNYQWTGDTPSAGIIAAVNGLPETANPLYSLTLDEGAAAMLALQAVISGEQWIAFLAWLRSEYEGACNTTLAATTTAYKDKMSLYKAHGFNQNVVDARAILNAVGLVPEF